MGNKPKFTLQDAPVDPNAPGFEYDLPMDTVNAIREDLIYGKSQRQISVDRGVCRRTVRRVANDPETFRIIRTLIQAKLTKHVGRALKTIVDIMENPASKDRDRLDAAKSIIDYSGITVHNKDVFNVQINNGDGVEPIIRFIKQEAGKPADEVEILEIATLSPDK